MDTFKEPIRAKRRRVREALWKRMYRRLLRRNFWGGDRSWWCGYVQRTLDNPADCRKSCCSQKKLQAWAKGNARYKKRDLASRADMKEF